MKLYQFLFLSLLILFIFHMNCGQGAMDPGSEYFTGITRTDENGNILQDDPDDWQPRRNMIDPLSVGPAYPNPFNNITTINFNTGRRMNVRITVNATPSQVVKILVDQSFHTGMYQYQLDMTDYDPGMYRVYFTAKDQEDNIYTSYGDVQLNK